MQLQLLTFIQSLNLSKLFPPTALRLNVSVALVLRTLTGKYAAAHGAMLGLNVARASQKMLLHLTQ
jgi:hypothetical protein